ncbi:MAG: transglutaminase domain-containing protein [Deltaproteobacteria bacterium]|nr:transglutaminase domain-containing protein [Deltaproteobacteria bacterium]
MLRSVRFGVVVVWAALLIALARSQMPPAATPPADPAALPVAGDSAAAEDAWSGLYMQGHKVGYAHSRTAPRDGGYRLDETSVMRLRVLDSEQTIRAVIDADTGADWAVRRFAVNLDTDLGAFDVRGSVAGDTLTLAMRSGGETTEQRVPISEPIYLPSAARAAAVARGLREGATFTVRVFDPSALEHQPMTIRVLGRESLSVDGVAQPAWKLRESFRGIESTVWLDAAGKTLREEGPMGLVTVRESATQAMNEGWATAPFDLMAAVAVRPAQPISDPRQRDELRLRVGGLESVAVPTDARQTLHDGTLTVRREPGGAASYTLPYAGDQWRGELAATPFLQIDHPSVQAAAGEALGDERDARRAAERLRRWVYGALEKRPAATIPNAVQVLQTRAGDCNEHAVLFAALARAAGLPARVVAGLVYADGVFLYHAWDEVWLGDGWVSVDAAFDQSPVDVTHIKLVEGGPEAHAALVPVIGRLTLDVLPGEAG